MSAITRPSMRLRAEAAKPLVASRKSAAVMLSLTEEGIDKLIKNGQLKVVKLGLRRVGIKMSSIEHVAELGVDA